MGGKAPQGIKMGILKPKGGWEKQRKINNFRIVGQSKLIML